MIKIGFDPFESIKKSTSSFSFNTQPDFSSFQSYVPSGSSSSILPTNSFQSPQFQTPSIPSMSSLSSMNLFGTGGSDLGSGLGGMFNNLPMPMGNLGKILNPLNLDKTKFWILVIIASIVTLLLAWGAYKIATHKQVQTTIRHAGGTIAGAGSKMGKAKMMG